MPMITFFKNIQLGVFEHMHCILLLHVCTHFFYHCYWAGESQSIVIQTDILLFLVFPWDSFTIRKM